MNRRDSMAVLLALGTSLSPSLLLAQAPQRSRPFRIGYPVAWPNPEAARQQTVKTLREFGWHEGKDFVLIDTTHRFDPLRAEEGIRAILAQNPDLIVCVSTAYALAAHRLTTTIPIVMFTSGYPVEAGLAHSLARPGKNVTGNTLYAGAGIWGKLIELLRESKPNARRIGILWSYGPPAFAKEESEIAYKELRAAALALGVALEIFDVPTPDRLRPVLRDIATKRVDALLVTGVMQTWNEWAEFIRFTHEKQLPTACDWLQDPKDQRPHALISYAPLPSELGRQMLYYVDRVMKGAKPGDLPIQQPSRFVLVIDLRTARAIGLKVPPSLLARADRVIE